MNPGPRISLTGAPGVGKTTLAHELAERLRLPLLPERSREVAREWGLTPATIPNDRLLEFQWAILDRQIAAEENHSATGFVSDRCPVDALCHYEWFGPGLGWPEEEGRRYRSLVETRVARYDLLIMVPPMFPPVDDGERFTDPAIQAGMHAVVHRLVADWAEGLQHRLHVVTELAHEARMRAIIDALQATRV